jgi:hypothetical protein
MTPKPDVSIIEVNDVYVLGETERCVLVVWRRQPTKAAFQRRNEAVADLAQRFPARCAYLELIEPTSRPPPSSLRQVSVEVFPKLGATLSCVGVVIEGSQVRSALVRAILTSMTFLIPQFQPYKVFKRRTEMAEWAGPRIGAEAGFTERLRDAFDLLRAAVPGAASGQGEGASHST